jgi:hypothetical protein
MADIATLSLTIDSRPVTDASRALDSLSTSARRTEQAVGGLERSAGAAATGSQRLEQEINRARAAADDLGMSAGLASGVIQRFFVGFTSGALLGTVAGLKAVKAELIEIDRVSRLSNLTLGQVNGLGVMGRMAGLSSEQVNQGITGLAEQLNKARREENELTRLMDANNQKWRDRAGNVIDVNQALEQAAILIAGAATNLDRIDIAKTLGLTAEWVPLLENGSRAFAQARAEAEILASSIDQRIVQAAKDFDSAWNRGWEAFAQYGKSAIMDIGRGLADLSAQASGFIAGLNRRFQSLFPQMVTPEQERTLAGYGFSSSQVPVSARPPGMTDATWETLKRWLRDRRSTGGDFAPWDRLQNGFRSTVIPSSRSGGAANDNESALDRQLRQIEERTRLIQQQSAAMGMSTYEAERHRSIQQALNADLRDGGEISKKFADAQALVAGSSSGLTPELEKQRQRILEVADAYAKAVQSARELRLSQDIAFERQTMFMPDSERNIASRLRSVYGEGWSEQMNGAIAQQMRFNAALREANDIAGDFGRTFVNDIMNGKSVTEALGNAVKNLGARLMQIALDRAINQLFGNLLGTFGSGLFGGAGAPLNLSSFMTASANGNVFAGGNVIPFARGGVVSGPTIFPMANGMGLMGEAGPEAVMPLKRNSRGQLGVVAQGAMPVVRGGNVTIINNGRPVDAKTEQDRDGNWTITLEDVADQVEGVMAKKVGSRRGPMASAIGSSFGIQQNGALVG